MRTQGQGIVLEKLRKACDFVDMLAMPSFVLSCYASGTFRLEHFNVANVETIGLPNEAIKGKTPHECLPARVATTVVKNYETCRTTRKPHSYEELLELCGVEKWWHTTLSPVFDDESNDVIGIIGVATDITERKEREFRRAETESALRKLNEDIALFTSMTAHDVREPLSKIASLSDLTLDGFADLGDNKRDMIVTMRKVANTSLKHIDGILGYAAALRLGVVEMSRIDLDHICSDIAAIVDPEARLDITSPECFIDGELAVLQLILRNLAENAVRHASARLRISVDEAPEGRLIFMVADDGPGFQGGSQAFAQKMKLREVSKNNRGFGLAAVGHLVESRGGSIWLDAPRFETGATICFDLPGKILCHALSPYSTALSA